jgi:uncharacterized protein YfdQ (DUF2303 family)
MSAGYGTGVHADPLETNVGAAVEAGILIGGAAPQVLTDRNGYEAFPYVLVPKNAELKSLAGQFERTFPKRRAAAVKLSDAPSFIAYVNAFKLPETRVFADPATNVVTAILDYHVAGESEANAARWGAHRVSLTLQHTEAWKRWTLQDGQKVDQLTFAEFIENNLRDIAEPDGSTILGVSRSLEATKEVGFKSGLRLSDGQTQLVYNERIEATAQVNQQQMAIPEKFVLGIVPFEGGTEAYSVTARLRYRIANGGKLSIGYDLLRPDLIVEDARKQTLSAIGEQIGLTILRGTAPEAFK